MDKRDRETMETVEEARKQQRGLDEQLKEYRRDRDRYERTVHGDSSPQPASMPASNDRRRTGAAPRAIRGRA